MDQATQIAEVEEVKELTKNSWTAWKTDIAAKVKAAKKQKKAPLQELLDSLLVVDKSVSENPDKGLLVEADELFNTIFKITYYDDQEFSISNQQVTGFSSTESQVILSHDQILAKIDSYVKTTVKINIVVNNLLLRQLEEVGNGNRD